MQEGGESDGRVAASSPMMAAFPGKFSTRACPSGGLTGADAGRRPVLAAVTLRLGFASSGRGGAAIHGGGSSAPRQRKSRHSLSGERLLPPLLSSFPSSSRLLLQKKPHDGPLPLVSAQSLFLLSSTGCCCFAPLTRGCAKRSRESFAVSSGWFILWCLFRTSFRSWFCFLDSPTRCSHRASFAFYPGVGVLFLYINHCEENFLWQSLQIPANPRF